MNQPYTYLIGWSKHNIWYYGCRYAVNCSPADLWVKYFTSSKRVKLTRAALGEPDVVQVRRTFESREQALVWENKVIRRMEAVASDKWLNMNHTSEGSVKMRPLKGVPKSIETRRKMSIARKNRTIEPPAWNKGIPMTEEAKKHLSEINKGKQAWNKGIPNDAARGVPRSEDVKARISESLKGRPRTEKQMQGQPHSDETKQRLSEIASKRRWYNNGEVTKAFYLNDVIPEGFVPGRLNFNPHRNKPE